MISKLIQKEKKRQEELLNSGHFENPQTFVVIFKKVNKKLIEFHKQFLINLKEYMEGMLPDRYIGDDGQGSWGIGYNDCIDEIEELLKADIQELTKMIKRYK